jgi:hypothetical protein
MAPRVSPTEREGSASKSSMVTGVTGVCRYRDTRYLSVFLQLFLLRDLVVFGGFAAAVGSPVELTFVGSIWLAMDAWAVFVERCRCDVIRDTSHLSDADG